VRFIRTLFTYALATSISLSPSIGSAAEKSQPAAPSSSNAPRIRIHNFGKVNTNYYRGAEPADHDYADLAALGIKTVIDLQQDGSLAEGRLVQAAGMKFQRIPLTTRVAPTSEELASFLQLVNDPANQPVFVHCAGGRHRTGVMTAVYRMSVDGWTAEQAFKEMKNYKFGADFLHPEFKTFVYSYRAGPDRSPAVETVTASRPL
jgi:protein tyrosine/serine phosphatase